MRNIKNLITTLAIITIGSYTIASADQFVIPEKTMQAAQTAVMAEKNSTTTATKPTVNTSDYMAVNPLVIVNAPEKYLNKKIKIKAKFDKFSTLGLDYEPAMKSSEKFISFLIQRPDVLDHNVPLSEMKIFLSRSEAEKHIDLNSGDVIEFAGKVFSCALGDPWIEVDNFTVISTTTKPKK